MEPKDLKQFKLSKKVKEKLKDKKLLKREIAKGRTAQEILELSDDEMATYYRAAHHLFENRHYMDAADTFLFLVTMNPHNHDHWLGLAMATQKLGNYEDAIDSYEMASYYEPDSPVPYFYLAQCFFAIQDREAAYEALDLTIEYAGENEEYADLKKQALESKKLMEKKKKQNK